MHFMFIWEDGMVIYTNGTNVSSFPRFHVHTFVIMIISICYLKGINTEGFFYG